MPTPAHIMIVHVAKKQLGLTDEQYRMVLKNTGKVYSSKDLSNDGLEDVMALFESRGFVDSKRGPGYWAGKVEKRASGLANERQVDLINRLAKSCRYSVPSMCEKFSGERTCYPEKLTSGEAWKLIEMMKGVNAREAARQAKIMEDDRAQQFIPF